MRYSLRRNNKAVSTVFGMVFFLLIVVIVFASFAVVLNQSTSLEAAMIQSRKMDLDRVRESLVLKQVQTDGTFKINNTGTFSAWVVRLWYEDSNGNYFSKDVDPSQQIIQPNELKSYVFPGGNDKQYRYWFVTARGNQFSYLAQGEKGVDGKDGSDGYANAAAGIGSLAMDFDKFSTYYTNRQSPAGMDMIPEPDVNSKVYALTVSNTKNIIIFHVVLYNVDPKGYDITMDSNSALYIVGNSAQERARLNG